MEFSRQEYWNRLPLQHLIKKSRYCWKSCYILLPVDQLWRVSLGPKAVPSSFRSAQSQAPSERPVSELPFQSVPAWLEIPYLKKKKKKTLASWGNNHSRKYPNIWSHCQRAPWGPLSLPLRVVCEQTTSCWAGLCTLRHLCYSSTDTFLDLERIILSEVWQTEKDKYHMISLIRGI